MIAPRPDKLNLPVLLLVLTVHVLAFAWALAPHRVRALYQAIMPSSAPAAVSGNATTIRQAGLPAASRSTGASPHLDDLRVPLSEQQVRDYQSAGYQRWVVGVTASTGLAPDRIDSATLQQLPQRLRHGDAQAASAAKHLEADCRNSPTGDQVARSEAQFQQISQSLNPSQRANLHVVISSQSEHTQALQRGCNAYQAVRSSVRDALHDYASGSSSLARLARIELAQEDAPVTGTSDPKALLDLRQLWHEDPRPEVTEAYARCLLSSPSPDDQKQASLLWSDLAGQDDCHAANVAMLLLGRDPDTNRDEIFELSAALGNPQAIEQRVAAADTAGDPALAWSWQAYRQWLGLRGNYARGVDLSADWLAADYAAIARRDMQFSPAQRQRATQLYLDRLDDYADRALVVGQCQP